MYSIDFVKREVGRQKLEKKGQSAEGAMHSIDFCEEEKRAPETSSRGVRFGW